MTKQIFSVQETEEPKRNFIAKTNVNVIGGNKTIRNILYLVKPFSRASDFKQISALNKEHPLKMIIAKMNFSKSSLQ